MPNHALGGVSIVPTLVPTLANSEILTKILANLTCQETNHQNIKHFDIFLEMATNL